MIDGSNWYALATLLAIVVGPITAVLVTRFIDYKSEAKARRITVFRNLLQTRGIRLDPLHVASLNVIELEFYKSEKVRSAFKAYIQHLASPMPPTEEQDPYFAQRSDLFTELLSEMGKELNYSFDKRDLDRHSYVPRGWGDDNDLQRHNAALINDLLSGRRAIPVTNALANPGQFPEAPIIEDEA